MFIVFGGVLNMGNIVFEMDENEGVIVKDVYGFLKMVVVSWVLFCLILLK